MTSSDAAPAAHASPVRCTACGSRTTVAPDAVAPPRCPDCGAYVPWLVAALDDTFAVEVDALLPVLVDFWAAWCGPCRHVTPLVALAAKQHAGRLKVVKVNVDRLPVVADAWRLQSIPTLALLVDGEEVDRMTGMVGPDALAAFLAPHLPGASPGA